MALIFDHRRTLSYNQLVTIPSGFLQGLDSIQSMFDENGSVVFPDDDLLG